MQRVTMKRQCITCEYYVAYAADEGKCYRYPPILNPRYTKPIDVENPGGFLYPHVFNTDDWCGEHVLRTMKS